MASNNKNSNNSQSNDDDWITDLILALFKALGYLLWWAVLFPAINIPIIASVGIAITHGPRPGLITGIALAAAYAGWAWLDPRSFRGWVTEPVRRRWLTWWRYTRSWDSVCTLHGLTAKLGERTLTPTLQSVQIGAHTDVLRLRIVTGQSVQDWHKQAEALAAAWRAERITVTATAPGELRITLMRGDILAEPITLPMPTPATIVDLAAVRVGITENLGWWRLPLLGHHILVAGATGRGQRLGVVVTYRRHRPRRENRTGAALRHRPQRRHGTGRWSTHVHGVHPRRLRHHPAPAAATGGGDAGPRQPVTRPDTPAHPHRHRTALCRGD